jgi:hypothetical protein
MTSPNPGPAQAGRAERPGRVQEPNGPRNQDLGPQRLGPCTAMLRRTLATIEEVPRYDNREPAC